MKMMILSGSILVLWTLAAAHLPQSACGDQATPRKSNAAAAAAAAAAKTVTSGPQVRQNTNQLPVVTSAARERRTMAKRRQQRIDYENNKGQDEDNINEEEPIRFDVADAGHQLTLNIRRQRRSTSSSGSAENTIQALVGQRLVVPCSNLTAALSSQQLTTDQLSRSTASGVQGNKRRQQAFKQQQQQPQTASSSSSSSSTSGGGGGGGISLIVWHKDDPQLSSPIFTIDARGSGGSLREARQQTGADWLRGRAHFEESTAWAAAGAGVTASATSADFLMNPPMSPRPKVAASASVGQTPALVIDEARQIDAGLYTCTVEFHKAPTQTHQIRVNLIDPPRDMVFRDAETGLVLTNNNNNNNSLTGEVGPFDEDSRLSVVCEVEPGKPAGQVSWWQLSSVTSIPAKILAHHPFAAASKSAEQSSGLVTSNSLANLDYLTTHGDDNQFVGLHAKPIQGADTELASSLIALGGSGGDGGAQKFKHWTRVKDVSLSIGDKTIQATLQLSPLSRNHQAAEFICLANNNQLGPPLNSSIQIGMNLKPSEVRIMDKQSHVFRLGEKIMIECQVLGSRPRAQIRWFKDKLQLEQQQQQQQQRRQSNNATSSDNNGYLISDINSSTQANNNTQISYLTFVPQLSDNMKSLTCLAHNPSIQSAATNAAAEPLSDGIIMNVQYPPQLRLQLGSGIKPEMIRVGSDVFMECNLESNPPIDDLTWYFNDQPVYANVSAGMIISNQSLVLQRIRVEHRGKYQCAAQNQIGRSISNKLDLRPKFEPICDYSLTKTRYEAAINQQIRVPCNVLAEPNDDIHFVWKFNQTSRSALVVSDKQHEDSETSAGYWPIEEIKQYETNFTSSYAIFSPKSRRHYGQLLCYASNSMGKQSKPCVISVIPPELPEPVYSCFFDGITNSSFSVYCQAPVENNQAGGRPSYLLELLASSTEQAAAVVANKSSAARTRHESGYLKEQQQQHQQNTQEDSRRGTTTVDDDEEDDNQEEPLSADKATTTTTTTSEEEQDVRRARSDSPSFHVSDLSPGTQYKATIYVQNSKGRSRPVSYPVTTTGDSPATTLVGSQQQQAPQGRVQFINKRLSSSSSSQESPSLADRLISYLRVDDYLSRSVNNYYGTGDQQQQQQPATKPLVAIVGIVLLSSCSIIVVAFFLTRLCRRQPAAAAAGQNTQRRTKRKDRIWSSGSNNSIGTKLSTYGGPSNGKAEVGQLQLTPAHSSSCGSSSGTATNRLKSLVAIGGGGGGGGGGSGSDTSRETNTDSTTLISSSINNNNNNNGNANGNCQMIESQRPQLVTAIVSTVSGSKMFSPSANHHHQAGAAAVRSSRESLYAAGAKSPIMMMMRPSQSAAAAAERNLYSAINRQQRLNCASPLHMTSAATANNTETPQMSIQSDCTTHSQATTSTTTNQTTTDLLMQVHQQQQQQHHNHSTVQELQQQSNSAAGYSSQAAIRASSASNGGSSNFVVPLSCHQQQHLQHHQQQQQQQQIQNRMVVQQNQNCLNSSPLSVEQQQQSIRLVGSKGAHQHQQQQGFGFAAGGWNNRLGCYGEDSATAVDNRSGNGHETAAAAQVDLLATANLVGYGGGVGAGSGNANACNHHHLHHDGGGGGGGFAMDPPVPAGFLPSSSSIPVSLSECQHLHLAGPRRRRYSQEFQQPNEETFTGYNLNGGSYLTLTPAGLLSSDSYQRQPELFDNRPGVDPQFINDLSQSFITYVPAEPPDDLCSNGGRASVDQHLHQQHHHHHHQCQTLDNSFRQSWRLETPQSGTESIRRASLDRPTRQHTRQRVKFDDQQQQRNGGADLEDDGDRTNLSTELNGAS